MQAGVAKCSCTGCGVHLEFPVELAGTRIICPNCQADTLLTLPEGPNAEDDGPREAAESELIPDDVPGTALSMERVVEAFRGKVKWHGTSFLYQLGLLLVTMMIVALPLVYIALIGLTGYGVYWWARNFAFLLGGRFHGVHLFTAKLLLYSAPLFAGSVIVFFMLKPLLARRGAGPQPLALNPNSEPLLFAMIMRICQTIGAPLPTRIDVDCELNASAGFRRGFRSLLGNDLVLTIGLPLVAAMSATQLAGVVAHEFGHFTQGFAMRLNYIVRRVNGWFARVIYERDEWDVTLAQWAAEGEDWRFQILVGVAQMGVWFSRLVLKGLMLIGVGSSSFVSRQMEYDADMYEIKFAGSRCFEEATLRMATFGESLQAAYKQMRVAWNSSRALPDSVPAFAVLQDRRMPPEKRAAIADRVGLERATLFSTHPASGDRIARARRANEPGVFSLEIPATELFENFDVLSRQVSLLHYTEEMEIPQPMIQLRRAETFFETPKNVPAMGEPNAPRNEPDQAAGPRKLKIGSPQA